MTTYNPERKAKGFAAITPERQKEIASKGGKAHSAEHMAEIGRKGGKRSKRGKAKTD